MHSKEPFSGLMFHTTSWKATGIAIVFVLSVVLIQREQAQAYLTGTENPIPGLANLWYPLAPCRAAPISRLQLTEPDLFQVR